jgi:TPR repeat protein
MSVSSNHGYRAQWLFAGVLIALPTVLIILQLLDHGQADDYVDAMAEGQFRLASDLIKPEADKQNPQAQNALANLYYLGLGVEQDFRRAANLYHAAASNGFAAAQLNLGHLYKQGFGVNKSAERAFGWYVHSKIAGSPWADYYLSQLSVELTLTPLQMATAKERWQKLERLAAEPL